MTEQPKDYVPPENGNQSREFYGEQIGSAITHLGKPKPELLWVLLLVIVIEGAQIWEADGRIVATQKVMDEIVIHLKTTEEHRSEEIRRMQEVVKELSQALGRRWEYEGRAKHESRLLNPEDSP